MNAAAAVGTLPTKLADAALEAAQASSEASTPNGEIAAPKFVPYVDFTGRIQHSPARLVAASVTGTTLRGTLVSENGFEVPIESDARSITTAELPQAVADFNRAAADLAGNPGELHTVATATVNAGSPQTEAQETGLPLPTAVSHPMVTYLAEHMLAGTLSIDISEWVNEPGAPSPRAAAVEARVQTPLAFVASTQISRGGSVVDVTYNYPEAERTRLQAETYETALAAIEQMDIQGADARSKITAFNDYLSDTVEYDYAAYEKYPSSDGHTAAYDATGALLEGTGVCASYAATMTLFAQVEGIEAVTISGKVIEGGYHAWNKFKVDGEWKAVDATWNDGDTPNHDYLLISDEEFSGHAAREEIPERWIVPAYADAYLAE